MSSSPRSSMQMMLVESAFRKSCENKEEEKEEEKRKGNSDIDLPFGQRLEPVEITADLSLAILLRRALDRTKRLLRGRLVKLAPHFLSISASPFHRPVLRRPENAPTNLEHPTAGLLRFSSLAGGKKREEAVRWILR